MKGILRRDFEFLLFWLVGLLLYRMLTEGLTRS